MFIEGYTNRGFAVSGSLVVGPCAVLPRAILQWNVSDRAPTCRPALRPLAEILVLGTGDRVERLHPALMKHMRACGIAVEVQDTANACATFNFLMSEKRLTAAALIPPRSSLARLAPAASERESC
uniref:NADH dehydrogenase [ubiquinone] 1 alpha subcomplex assembly factor 3 n=1 Tax=Nothoprocta perdicaria TaxID=30464 RepID=A0A8C6Z0W7_NOTPE